MRYDLQVLRAFSVFLVFVYHLDIGYFQGGFIGVDIFFVLSGYFTAQMLAQHKHNLNGVTIFLNRRLIYDTGHLTVSGFEVLSKQIVTSKWGAFYD